MTDPIPPGEQHWDDDVYWWPGDEGDEPMSPVHERPGGLNDG